MMLVGGKTREKITGQIREAADKIGATVLACLAVAVAAVLRASQGLDPKVAEP